MEIKSFKNKLFSQQDLTTDESAYLFELIMSGKLNEIDIAAILTSLFFSPFSLICFGRRYFSAIYNFSFSV